MPCDVFGDVDAKPLPRNHFSSFRPNADIGYAAEGRNIVLDKAGFAEIPAVLSPAA
jgi:hypothetical protein